MIFDNKNQGSEAKSTLSVLEDTYNFEVTVLEVMDNSGIGFPVGFYKT